MSGSDFLQVMGPAFYFIFLFFLRQDCFCGNGKKKEEQEMV